MTSVKLLKPAKEKNTRFVFMFIVGPIFIEWFTIVKITSPKRDSKLIITIHFFYISILCNDISHDFIVTYNFDSRTSGCNNFSVNGRYNSRSFLSSVPFGVCQWLSIIFWVQRMYVTVLFLSLRSLCNFDNFHKQCVVCNSHISCNKALSKFAYKITQYKHADKLLCMHVRISIYTCLY